MIRTKNIRAICLTMALFLFNSCSDDKPKSYIHSFDGQTMGTTYQVKISSLNQQLDTNKIQKKVEKILFEINQKMSTYIQDSELSLVNLTPSTKPLQLSKSLYFVLRLAKQISSQSDNYFDITVGPLVNAWGFGPKRVKTLPSEQKIKSIMEYVGDDKFELEPEMETVTKKHKNVYLDLSAIAKGHAVDEISKTLTSMEFTSHLVEIGGELKAGVRKTADLNWQVAVESPGKKNAAIILPLESMSIATSGNYKQFIHGGKKRFGHTIDPKTGQATFRSIISASVLHLSCAQADAWATAFMAMGIEKATEFAAKNGIAAYFIVKDKQNRVSEVRTDEFKKLLAAEGKK